ncbi:MAG: LuxR C-terminal-related transcriptional regulator [Gemmatimonadota bacterium]
MLREDGGEGAEQAYLLLPEGQRRLAAGDGSGAYQVGSEVVRAGERFDDRDLLALGVHLQGRALLVTGDVEEGLALLDEAMVAVATDELTPPVTGLLYCSIISACRSVFDLGRAREWTAALTRWCERQPDMVAYAGECRLYRAELLQLRGEWDQALEEARRAAEHAGERPGPVAGLAHYRIGELHRLRGEFTGAERAFRQASRRGREPQPGLALLRLARGDPDAAAASLRRAMAEATGPLRRARLLPACIEVMIAAGTLDEADEACRELDRTARELGTGLLGTASAHGRGALALAAGEAATALPLLRRAWREWRTMEAPYRAARARLLLGLACRALDDEEGATLEIDAAAGVFEALGARHDAERARTLGGSPDRRRRYGLTPREMEVLALVAEGLTNRAVGERLFFSEKTVARHMSNIFLKLQVSSRAAATAFAYEHGLLGGAG